ncbi:MAG: ribonuclease HII [Fimbriimonadaceae bacterium]|nr:ribonuclease HII [Fimbriimonadaceae bacterium]
MDDRSPCIWNPDEAGVDEAGRGPLAGPVVVAAVVLPKGFDVAGIGDSKALSVTQRERQAERIKDYCSFSIVVVGVDEIDRRNILWATMDGMSKSLEGVTCARAVIDGNRVPFDAPVPCSYLIKGDARHPAIAAASILAKTERDRLMVLADDEYPGYGFAKHKGYSAPEHLAALRKLGPCPIHRRSFAPVRELLEQPALFLS